MSKSLGEQSAFHDYSRSPGLRHIRTHLSDTHGARNSNTVGICVVGDSTAEGAGASKRGFRWVNQLATRLSANRGGLGYWIPVSAGTYHNSNPGGYPGSESPIRYLGVNEVQLVTITGTASSGTFTLTLPSPAIGLIGAVPTGAISPTASLAALQTIVNTAGFTGKITVGGSVGAWTLTYAGDWAGINMSQAIATNSMVGATVAVTTTTNGTVGGSEGYGLAGHGLTVVGSAGSYVEVDFLGDFVNIFYASHSAGATHTMTVDGVAIANTIVGFSGSTIRDLVTSAGTAGDFGFHTVRIAVDSGTLILEGFRTSDMIVYNGFGIPSGGVFMYESTRGGLSTAQFAAGTSYDTTIDGTPIDLFIISLGENDRGADETATELFKTDLITLMTRLESRANSNSNATFKRPTCEFLLIGWWTFPDAWINALRDVAAKYGRTTVLDLHDHFAPGDISNTDATYGVSSDGTHPNDRAQGRIAEIIHSILEPVAQRPRNFPQPVVTIDALTTPATRSNWAENFGLSIPSGAYTDSSPTVVTTKSERRHRVWFDAGSYEFRMLIDEDTNKGNGSLWFDGVQQGSTFDSYNLTAQATLVYLGTKTITSQSAGWHYITIRKNGTKNADSSAYGITFRQLTIIRKTIP